MRLRLIGLGLAVLGAGAFWFCWLARARRVAAMVVAEFAAPVPRSEPEPGDREFRPVSWELPGVGSQHALYSPPRNGTAVVFAHGSPGRGADFLPEARHLFQSGTGALLLDFPGYGGSEGRRDWGLDYDRAVAAGLDFLAARPEVDPGRLGLFGYSMGTGVACRVAASDRRVAALILVAPFTTLEEQLCAQYQSRWPGMGWVAARTARRAGVRVGSLRPIDLFSGRSRPERVLCVAGERDRVVPPEMVQELAGEGLGVEYWLALGADHADYSQAGGQAYFDRIQGFLGGPGNGSALQDVPPAGR